jgi:hypothetical protein
MTAATTDIVTVASHGRLDGEPVIFTNTGGALPAGITAATVYYVKKINANTFYLCTTVANCTKPAFTVVAGTDVCTSGSAHGLTTGDAITFWSTTTLPAGLTRGTTYYAYVTAPTTFQLYDTAPHAVTHDGTGLIDITDTGTGTHYLGAAVDVTDTGTGTHSLDGTYVIGTGTTFTDLMPGDTVVVTGGQELYVSSVTSTTLLIATATATTTLTTATFRRRYLSRFFAFGANGGISHPMGAGVLASGQPDEPMYISSSVAITFLSAECQSAIKNLLGGPHKYMAL